jgi:hypothetical protein
MMAHLKQAKEHDDQQDKVGNKYRDEGCCIASRIENATVAERMPSRANLRMSKHKDAKYIEIDPLPD